MARGYTPTPFPPECFLAKMAWYGMVWHTDTLLRQCFAVEEVHALAWGQQLQMGALVPIGSGLAGGSIRVVLGWYTPESQLELMFNAPPGERRGGGVVGIVFRRWWLWWE